VQRVLIDRKSGEITTTFKSTAIGVSPTENTIILSPYIHVSGTTMVNLETALSTGQNGTLDWACSSKTQQTATFYGMTGATLGTMQPKYVPSACR
jgi:type IV pilus assembly protein PilA